MGARSSAADLPRPGGAGAGDLQESLRVVDLPGRPTFGSAAKNGSSTSWPPSSAPTTRDRRPVDPRVLPAHQQEEHQNTIAAGIMLTAPAAVLARGRRTPDPGADQEVADNSFKPAAAMVRADSDLADLLRAGSRPHHHASHQPQQPQGRHPADTETVSGEDRAACWSTSIGCNSARRPTPGHVHRSAGRPGFPQ